MIQKTYIELKRDNAKLRECLKAAIKYFRHYHSGDSTSCYECEIVRRAERIVARKEKGK